MAKPKQTSTIYLAIPAPDTSHGFKFFGLVYRELFARVGYKAELVSMSGERARFEGQINLDGQVGRVAEYQQQAVNQLKVPEVIVPIYFAAYGNLTVDREGISDWQSLSGFERTIAYKHGSIIPALKLSALVADDYLDPVTHISQGLKKLKAGRADLVVGLITEIEPYLQSDEFATISRISVLSREPIYLYLHQRHSRLIPSLVMALRNMKQEHLIKSYWREAGLPDALFY
ncbi:hypothetical protein K0504_12680 [Neiella marina]|uniref:Solute-binding protein family 3/N-terminal domain-containing protein n=1 Tax=Neiella holothuriorum TaxID=2870530 RepID=A0ABS7EI30_9GAMM|nr:hypothetical protein [Neiella holothuriorum]MBW8191894.1 hypothetical protein [Neiella holothuriorum]